MKTKLWLMTAITGYLLTACSSYGIGTQSFNIEGEIPANMSVEFLTQYEPLNGEGCYWGGDRVGGEVTTGKIEAKPTAQHYKVSVPLTTRIHGCKTHAMGVRALIIDTRTATKQSSGLPDFVGFLGIDPYNKESLPKLNYSILNIECARYFKLKNGIFYTLQCKWHDKERQNNFKANDLSGNTVLFNIRFNKEEKPSVLTSWRQTDKGWKPCKGAYSSMAGYCGDKPEFRTFEMNGKTCTIYPGCTE